MSEDEVATGVGGDAVRRLATAKQDAERARERATDAGRRAHARAAGQAGGPEDAAARVLLARESLAASLRSSAEAHRRAARRHEDAAEMGSGSLDEHHVEAARHLDRAAEDDARAARVESGCRET
jgi:hypothetical protein